MDERLRTLREKLSERGCDAFLFEDPISLYYLTGLHLSSGQLLVYRHEEMHLLVDKRYLEGAKERFPEAAREGGEEAFLNLLKKSSLRHLAISDRTAYGRVEALRSSLLPEVELRPLANPLIEQRMIKDGEELQKMRRAAQVTAEGFDFLCQRLCVGVTEQQLANELAIFWLKKGGYRLAFDPIIAFEPRNSQPHYTPQNLPLHRGQSVLIDIGAQVDHYLSDMTRTLFFGEPHPKMLEIYQVVRAAQEAALARCAPGITCGALDETARDLIAKAGYGDAFTHSLGHSLGLEIHEPPRLREKTTDGERPLQPGMTITIEPGIYLPTIGGVRIEDTIAITTTGYEDLIQRPKEPLIILYTNPS